MYDDNGNFYKPHRGSAEKPDHIFLSFNTDPHTSMTVSWRTSTDTKGGYALCREDGSEQVIRHDATFITHESDIDISNFYWVNITGLKPDTKYFYTVGDDENRSKE